MRNLLQDLRYGLRMVWKNPGFTLVAVAALALGIGANTAIFSVVNSVLLRALPYEDSERLVSLYTTSQPDAVPTGPFSYLDYLDFRAQTEKLEHLAAFQQVGTVMSTGSDEPERVRGTEATASLFATLGARAALGRVYTEEEDREGAQGVVVISDGLWKRRFGSDPGVINRDVKMGLAGRTVTVIGVMPPGFKFPSDAEQVDYYVPFVAANMRSDRDSMNNRSSRFIPLVGKLKKGVTVEEASAEATTIAGRLAEQYPEFNTNQRVRLVGMHEDLVGGYRRALLILLGAVGFVLLIACANVANLQLARAASRGKEIAIRTALGATRGRIVRQLLTESVLLSLVGGALGLLLAWWGVDLLVKVSPANVPRLAETAVDSNVFFFTFAVSALTGFVFGLAPALQASKLDLTETLKEGGRTGAEGARRNRLRSLLVVTEVALSLVLLVGAGLLVKSFWRLTSSDPGYSPERVLALRVALASTRYPDEESRAGFFARAIERVTAVPGVEAAGVSSLLPLGGRDIFNTFNIAGRPAFGPGQQQGARSYMVSPDYFRAMSIPLRRGRAFSASDTRGAQPVIIVNEAFARKYFPEGNALGESLILDDANNQPLPPREIVGVVGSVRYEGLNDKEQPEYYVPFAQSPDTSGEIVVRSSAGDAASLASTVRAALKEVDANLLIWETRTMDELVSRSVAPQRFNVMLLGLFAALALVLASVGIYGVMSYTVAQRTHEIGIRMALGAQAADVLRLVVRQGMLLALAGVGIGLAAAFALTRVMSSLLFGVSATDATTFVTVPALIVTVAFLACFIPALRATRVDPMMALRYE